MKRFYFAIIIFVIPIVVFIGGAEFFVRQIPNEYKYKNDWMEEHAEEVETLILGSSHTQLGVCPELLGKHSFNLAMSGRTPRYDMFMLKKWADRFSDLKLVIMPISYFSLFFKEPVGMNNGPTLYKIYFGCPEYSDFSLYNVETLFFKGLHAKIYAYLNNIVKYDEKGWVASALDLKDTVNWNSDINVKYVLKGTTASSYEYVEENFSYLHSMAYFCNVHHIRLVFVTTPIWRTYSEKMNKKQLSITYDKIAELQKEFGVEYYDYSNDNRFVSGDFFDVQHLSLIGAKKFTRILVNDLKIVQK